MNRVLTIRITTRGWESSEVKYYGLDRTPEQQEGVITRWECLGSEATHEAVWEAFEWALGEIELSQQRADSAAELER